MTSKIRFIKNYAADDVIFEIAFYKDESWLMNIIFNDRIELGRLETKSSNSNYLSLDEFSGNSDYVSTINLMLCRCEVI